MSDAAQSPPTAPSPAAAPAEEQQLPGPGAFLKGVVGQPVVVRLNSGVDYRGTSVPSDLTSPPPRSHDR